MMGHFDFSIHANDKTRQETRGDVGGRRDAHAGLLGAGFIAGPAALSPGLSLEPEHHQRARGVKLSGHHRPYRWLGQDPPRLGRG